MIIQRAHIPKNVYGRSGKRKLGCRGIAVHFPDAPGWSVQRLWRYFASDVVSSKRYASAEYGIGDNGEILEFIPPEEIAYAVGANKYTEAAQRIFRTPWGKVDPNYYMLNVEVTHPGKDAKPTNAAWKSLVWFLAKKLYKCGLNEQNIWRHYDISLLKAENGSWYQKRCHKYFVDHPKEFLRLREEVAASLKTQRRDAAIRATATVFGSGIAAGLIYIGAKNLEERKI